ncbi:dihydroxyacetone kinase subunit DhaL [Ancylobacter lacus]|uniref:dihydroxyacetone kinase subunit DhaL n=1 Tax=Ancylobacter lacus TaxID=2579970 RepID=UPI001BCE0F9F|nr:dihydroxyacetone kinase subunit DhaL [Ancylobacter lacus]MBS7537816.1 dihydroxyacetone kinase subunit L [Ancylobacter lacus]
MDAEQKKTLIQALAGTVIAHAEELTALDQAIGDGDHGLNMKRGFEAVLAEADALAQKPLPDALKAVGTQLVMKVGGASGPLYGTFFMALGKEVNDAPTLAELSRALAAALAATRARGKSEPGQKTLLDVLTPVLAELEAGIAEGAADLPARLKARAAAAAEATVPMRAVRGRASFLGDRSIGHMDPGARSSALMIAALCDALAAAAPAEPVRPAAVAVGA